MTAPGNIAEIDQLITAFYRATNDEDRLRYEQILTECRNSPDWFPVWLEMTVSPTVSNLSHVFALMAICDLIRPKEDRAVNIEATGPAFQCCLENLARGFELGKNVFVHMLKVISISAFYNPDLFPQLSQIPDNGKCDVFAMYLQEREAILNRNPTIQLPALPLRDTALEILKASPLSQSWFELHRYALKIDASFEAWLTLIPKLQGVCDEFDSEYGGALFDLYDEVLAVQPEWLWDSPTDLQYVMSFIRIMVDLAKRLIQNLATDDSVVHYVSTILTATIDFGMSFYENASIVKFSEEIFEDITQLLPLIKEADITDFFAVLSQISATIGEEGSECDDESEDHAFDSGKWIELYLKMIIEEIDRGNLEMCCPDMEEIVANFTAHERGGVNQFLAQSCVSNPSPGLYYVIAFSGMSRLMLATQMALRLCSLPSPDQTPVTCIYFIIGCAEYAKDFIECFLKIVFYWVGKAPSALVAEAIHELAMLSPGSFVTEDGQYLQPLWGLLAEAGPDAANFLISAMLAILRAVPIPEADLGRHLQQLGDVFVKFIPAQFADATEVANFVSFLEPIIVRDWRTRTREGNDERRSGQEREVTYPPVMQEFFVKMFEIIRTAIGEIWVIKDDEVQRTLCSLVVNAIRYRWLLDASFVVEWLLKAISECPVSEHIKGVMVELIPLMPIPQFTKIFEACLAGRESGGGGYVIDSMTHALYDLMFQVVKQKREKVKEIFPVDMILYPITSPDGSFVFGDACKVVGLMAHVGAWTPQELEVVIEKLVSKIVAMRHDYRRDGVETLHALCVGYHSVIGAQKVADRIHSVFVGILGRDPPEIVELCALLAVPVNWNYQQARKAAELIHCVNAS